MTRRHWLHHASLSATTHPSRAEWLADRRQSLGASDSPKIAGLSRFGGPMSVYADKLGLVYEAASASEAAEWGLLLEPLVADRYARETGLELLDPGPFTLVRNAAYPALHVSPDRYIVHPTRGLGVLSIKTTSAFQADAWLEEAPPAYQVQSQHEMLVADVQWAAIAVLIGGQRFQYVECIERDEKFCKRLLGTLEGFWASVIAREPPPVDASDACRAVLRSLFPKEEGTQAIALPVELVEMDTLWAEAKAQLDHWEDQKALAENTFRAALGPAPKGVLPNGIAWTHKTQVRKAYEVPAAEFRVLRRTKKG